MTASISAELEGIDLGDKRLNRRSKQVLEALAAQPQASINAACQGWSDTLAAYRLFDNPAVSAEKILAPHAEATRQRIQQHSVVLLIQDTTEFDLSRHPPKDARCLEQAYRRGFYDHTYLAVTPACLVLGVLGGEQFDRAAESLGKARQRKALPLEEKESFRWLQGYRQAALLAADCPATRIVSVSDSEADIYEIFLEANQPDRAADILIRAKENRCTPQRDPQQGPATYCKVRDEIVASPVRLCRVVDLPETSKRAARRAKLEIRSLRITVRPPPARYYLPTVTYNLVLAEEIAGPQDGTDVSWLLITTLSIETEEDLLLVLDYYVARWVIEVYFRVLKTGCKVEEMQLETLSRVKNCLAFYKIIAWRIVHLTYLQRASPTLPCSVAFADAEWQAAWQVVKQEPPPGQPPTLREVMSLVAQLGGYNARAQDPPPGPQVLWTGLRRLLDFTLAWQAFRQTQERVVYK